MLYCRRSNGYKNRRVFFSHGGSLSPLKPQAPSARCSAVGCVWLFLCKCCQRCYYWCCNMILLCHSLCFSVPLMLLLAFLLLFVSKSLARAGRAKEAVRGEGKDAGKRRKLAREHEAPDSDRKYHKTHGQTYRHACRIIHTYNQESARPSRPKQTCRYAPPWPAAFVGALLLPPPLLLFTAAARAVLVYFWCFFCLFFWLTHAVV